MKCTQGWVPRALVLLLHCPLPTGSARTGNPPLSFSVLQTPFAWSPLSAVASCAAVLVAVAQLHKPSGFFRDAQVGWTPDWDSTPGRPAVSQRKAVQTHLRQAPPKPPGKYLLSLAGRAVLFDLLLVSRRPGQKAGGVDSGEASLPGYCVTWDRLLSFSKPVPSAVVGVDTTCPGTGGDKALNRLCGKETRSCLRPDWEGL